MTRVRRRCAIGHKASKSPLISLYIRIVDKGVGRLWSFCKWLAWGDLQSFLGDEGYVGCSWVANSVIADIKQVVICNNWSPNPNAKLGCLYLLGKRKSLVKKE